MLGKLVKGVGCLFLGVLFLSACGSDSDEQKNASNNESKTEEVRQSRAKEEKEKREKEARKKAEEKKKENEKFTHADFVGAEEIDKDIKKEFEKDGYSVYFNSADFLNGENYLLLPAYNNNHKMYDDILTVIPIINGIPIKNEMQYLISASPYHLEGDLIDASDGLAINDAGDKLGSYHVILIKAQKDLTLSSKKYNKSFTVTYDDSNVANGIAVCLRFAQSQSK